MHYEKPLNSNVDIIAQTKLYANHTLSSLLFNCRWIFFVILQRLIDVQIAAFIYTILSESYGKQWLQKCD